MGKIILNIVKWFFIVSLLIIIVFPALWAIMSAFKSPSDMFTSPPVWIFRPNFQNFLKIIIDRNVYRNILNSLIIAVANTFISVFIGSLAGYVLARAKFKGSNFLAFLFLFGRLIPPVTFIIPYYLILIRIGLYDTHIGVIMTYLGFSLPFSTWIMRSFFMGIPKELEEAGFIDGCNHFNVLYRIILPLAAPGLGTAMIFVFLNSWNEFIYAFMFTRNTAVTLPVLAASFVTPQGVLWGEIFAVSVIIMAPMIIIGLIVRNFFIKGLTLGAVKG